MDVKQGWPAISVLVSLYLDELEALLEGASEHIDCPRHVQLLIAMLMSADDITLISCSAKGCSTSSTSHRSSVLHEDRSCPEDQDHGL